jgi:ABC-type nitrate/sulfonate/bicarbonate transport system substrate-binding protein
MRLKPFWILVTLLLAKAAVADQHLVLQLKWKPQFQFAGYYVAQELGYYKEAGLDVEIRAGGPGKNSLAEVLGGEADFGVSSSHLLAERIKGAPVKALAAIFQNSPARFITLKSSNIETPKQLAGKRVMLLPQNASFELVTLLTQLNLMQSIERVDTNFDIDSLVDGDTDAFNGYETNEPYTLQ